MLITLLTDFGTADYFVGAMKGVVLSACRQAQVVDITHEIPAHDIAAGAFTLRACYQDFPDETIHVAVVDPGVGSERRPIAVRTRRFLFLGPDNGLFTHIYENESDHCEIYHLANREFFRPHVSATFHGRDLFAHAAALLACAQTFELTRLGRRIDDPVRLPYTAARLTPEGRIEASIIHIDRFGNCITNLTRELFAQLGDGRHPVRLSVGQHEIPRFRSFFAEDEASAGEPFAIWGSAGFLEIAVFLDSAARRLGITRGQSVEVSRRSQ